MVDAKTSGVMYTVDPNDSRHGVVMISAVWGLGVSLVEGSTSNDFYQVNKVTGEVEISEKGAKECMLSPDVGGGIKEHEVPASLRQTACLDLSHIRMLLDSGLKLEEHYGYPLDIEWAIDQSGKLFILQARPLRGSQKFGAEEVQQKRGHALKHQPPSGLVLLRGGSTASEGTASGPAYVVTSDHKLHRIPEGAVLIARQTSPRFVPIMGRIGGIVTDVGSVTGHMASVAREFQIPTLVGTGTATETIPHGEEVTIDATNRVVYRGHIDAILKKRKPVNPMKGSPIYNTVHSALKRIAPLNLTDPREENFKPDACQTLHDIIRFSHEMAMQEMFRIGEEVRTESITAVPLKMYLPLRVFVVDLGGGLSLSPGVKEALIEDVSSGPFRGLLKGMTHEDVDWSQDLGVGSRDSGAKVSARFLPTISSSEWPCI